MNEQQALGIAALPCQSQMLKKLKYWLLMTLTP